MEHAQRESWRCPCFAGDVERRERAMTFAGALPARSSVLDELDIGAARRCTVHRAPLPLPTFSAGLRSPEKAAVPTRAKLARFNANLHCSIIGTCLSGSELRGALLKLKLIDAKASEHEVHKIGVTVAGGRGIGPKMLNKALDRKFERHIAKFAKVKTEAEVAALWAEALQAGDIPGAYWAALTHPATSDALVYQVFGEIHMLSHLVGAANRADIRRLRELEGENDRLRDKIERQQSALQAAVTGLGAKIKELEDALVIALDERRGNAGVASGDGALQQLVVEQARRLARAEARVAHVESRSRELERRLATAAAAADAVEAECTALRDECAALHRALDGDEGAPAGGSNIVDIGGAAILYVGGRANQIAHLRRTVEDANGRFIHHSGGLDDNPLLLPGCISRAEFVLFPVDCIGHQAMNEVKRYCKQSGKPYLPLRTGSTAALLLGLDKVRQRLAAADGATDRVDLMAGA
jgi:hypothetical protein